MSTTAEQGRSWFSKHIINMSWATILGLAVIVVMHYADYNWTTSIAAGVVTWAILAWSVGRQQAQRARRREAEPS